MTDPATPLLVERINRLGIAVAELTGLHARQNRALMEAIEGLGVQLGRGEDRLAAVERAVHAFRADTHVDEREDRPEEPLP